MRINFPSIEQVVESNVYRQRIIVIVQCFSLSLHIHSLLVFRSKIDFFHISTKSKRASSLSSVNSILPTFMFANFFFFFSRLWTHLKSIRPEWIWIISARVGMRSSSKKKNFVVYRWKMEKLVFFFRLFQTIQRVWASNAIAILHFIPEMNSSHSARLTTYSSKPENNLHSSNFCFTQLKIYDMKRWRLQNAARSEEKIDTIIISKILQLNALTCRQLFMLESTTVYDEEKWIVNILMNKVKADERDSLLRKRNQVSNSIRSIWDLSEERRRVLPIIIVPSSIEKARHSSVKEEGKQLWLWLGNRQSH